MFSSDPSAIMGAYLIANGFAISHADSPLIHPFSQSLASWNVSGVTNMTGMLSGSSLSIAEYDATLAGWEAQTLQNNVTLGADRLYYCESSSERADIIGTYSWTIDDDGAECLYLAPGSGLVGIDVATENALVNPNATERIIRLLKNGLPLGEATILFNDAVDWSNVSGAVDTSSYKSVVSGLAGADATVNGHTLYVPKAAFHNAVVICPDATIISQVSESCSNSMTLTENSLNVSIVNIDGNIYWKVDQLTGTGGVSIIDAPGAPNAGVGPTVNNIIPVAPFIIFSTASVIMIVCKMRLVFSHR